MDSGVTWNYISLKIVEVLGIPYRPKENLYLLIIIIREVIAYRGGIINIKTELIELRIKGQAIIMSFNILLLGNNKAVLGMP